jgi:hypothetical protein
VCDCRVGNGFRGFCETFICCFDKANETGHGGSCSRSQKHCVSKAQASVAGCGAVCKLEIAFRSPFLQGGENVTYTYFAKLRVIFAYEALAFLPVLAGTAANSLSVSPSGKIQ